ncbi:MAG: hypothetical protein QX189_18050, partial [Methylococcales bacterium]
RLDIFSKIVSSSFMEIFFQGGVFEDSIFPEFKISSLLFQKTVRTIDLDLNLIKSSPLYEQICKFGAVSY